MRKWVYTGIGTVVVGALLLALTGTLFSGTRQVGAQQTANTATIEKTTLNSTIETTGSVVPAQSLYLTFGTGGKLKELKAEIGTIVKAGDALAMLDTADLEYQVKLAEQQLAAEQANYDALIAPPSEKDIAQAKATLASAKSQLASAQISAQTGNDSITSSCADVDSKKLSLDRAQTTYNDFVKDGYSTDANFLPDPDSEAATKLRDAQRAYDVAVANCNTAKLNSDASLKVASAQASVDQAQAALDALMAGASKEDINARKAQLEQKKLNLDNAKKNLDNAKITAPYNGVITAVPVVAGQQVTTQTNIMTLADMSALYVDIDVDEQYINQVKVDQDAIIELNADDSAPLNAKVSRVAPSGESKSGVVTYSVRLAFKDAQINGVMPGMTGDVTLNVGTLNDVLVVPTQAIQRDNSGEFVQIVTANGNVRTPITSGKTVGGKTVITGNGISAGQVVLLVTVTSSTGGGFAPPGAGGGQ
jgi:HlyD family secretion protein